MKRFAVLLLTLALAVCCTLPAFAADTIEVNEDVSVSGDYDWTRFKGQNMAINVYNWGEYISNVIGTMTPPVAVNIFSAVQVTRSVRELKIGEISKAEIPFFIGYVAVFFLCVFSETFCTFLIR